MHLSPQPLVNLLSPKRVLGMLYMYVYQTDHIHEKNVSIATKSVIDK